MNQVALLNQYGWVEEEFLTHTTAQKGNRVYFGEAEDRALILKPNGDFIIENHTKNTATEHFADHLETILIADRWAGRLGLGWHPDTRAGDYTPAMDRHEQAEYAADMTRLAALADDPYAEAIGAWERAGLVQS